MPGQTERTPSRADRPPVSRVGDELQQRTPDGVDEVADGDAAAIEDEAYREAQRKGWDKDLREEDDR